MPTLLVWGLAALVVAAVFGFGFYVGGRSVAGQAEAAVEACDQAMASVTNWHERLSVLQAANEVLAKESADNIRAASLALQSLAESARELITLQDSYQGNPDAEDAMQHAVEILIRHCVSVTEAIERDPHGGP
jgi:uncharacterized protein HemX